MIDPTNHADVSCAALAASPDLETLYARLAPLSVGPGWSKPTPSIWPEPRKTFEPAHWSYERTRAGLTAAGRLIDTKQAERRNLILINPIEGNTYATTRTLVAAYQAILPGETARSHRHSPNALRLMVEGGPGIHTVVDGQSLPMLPGDVLLTPNWRWHGHASHSDRPAFWIDFLDAPLVQLLEPMFLEHHPAVDEPVREVVTSSPMRFAWEDTKARLAAAPRTPEAPLATAVQLGDPALTTIALHVLALAPGVRTARYRTTANAIFAVIEGEGESDVDGVQLSWRRGDVFAVPAWRPHHHRAAVGAALLRVSDEAMHRALGLLREVDA